MPCVGIPGSLQCGTQTFTKEPIIFRWVKGGVGNAYIYFLQIFLGLNEEKFHY